MTGIGESGRRDLLERPTQDEVEMVLWRMVFGARQREDELRMECEERDERCQKRERELKCWEENLEVKERKLEKVDSGIEKTMKDLRIKDSVIVGKEEDIIGLKSEMEERVFCAREECEREMKV